MDPSTDPVQLCPAVAQIAEVRWEATLTKIDILKTMDKMGRGSFPTTDLWKIGMKIEHWKDNCRNLSTNSLRYYPTFLSNPGRLWLVTAQQILTESTNLENGVCTSVKTVEESFIASSASKSFWCTLLGGVSKANHLPAWSIKKNQGNLMDFIHNQVVAEGASLETMIFHCESPDFAGVWQALAMMEHHSHAWRGQIEKVHKLMLISYESSTGKNIRSHVIRTLLNDSYRVPRGDKPFQHTSWED